MGGDAHPYQGYWLWAGGTLTTIALGAVGAGASLEAAAKVPYNIWTSPGFFVAYGAAVCVLICLTGALREWTFPGTRSALKTAEPPVPQSVIKPPAPSVGTSDASDVRADLRRRLHALADELDQFFEGWPLRPHEAARLAGIPMTKPGWFEEMNRYRHFVDQMKVDDYRDNWLDRVVNLYTFAKSQGFRNAYFEGAIEHGCLSSLLNTGGLVGAKSHLSQELRKFAADIPL